MDGALEWQLYNQEFVVPDMDVTECEQRRFEFIDDLTDLEKQFAILREQ